MTAARASSNGGPGGRFGTALLDVDGTVLQCDAIWESTVGVDVGGLLADAVCPEDRVALADALADTGRRFAVVVRTGRTDGALVSHLLAEGVHRDGVWYVIGVRSFQPGVADGPARRDPLTGLLDRAGLDAALGDAVDRVARGDSAAVLLVDLDDFKAINDVYGHAAGDRLLVDVGAAIAGAVRGDAVAARHGGDEFAIVLVRTTSREARVVAERVLGAVERARAGEFGVGPRPAASVGLVALSPDAPIAANEALVRADLALYAAKSGQRGGVVEYPTGDTEAAVRLRVRHAWGQRLRRALDADAFVLYADPVVDLRTGMVDGAELVLHLHDGDEPVPRDAVLEAQLHEALALRLDRRLVEHAVTALGRDGGALGRTVAVGVSGALLEDEAFAADAAELMRAHAAVLRRLVLVVRDGESVDAERAARNASALAELGVRFGIDGFGTGRGAPVLLRAVPGARIRLDDGFASADGATALDDAVVRHAVALGDALDLVVAAAGVEEPADLERLRDLGVRSGQGPLFGGPRPHADPPASIARRVA